MMEVIRAFYISGMMREALKMLDRRIVGSGRRRIENQEKGSRVNRVLPSMIA